MSSTNITLYVSDLDGTLLNSQSQLSATTVSALNHLIRDKGILFSIATARTPATVSRIMQDVDTNLPYIVMAGAALWDNTEQNYHQTRFIPKDIVAEILDIYRQHPVHPFIYRQHGHCIYAHHVPTLTASETEFIEHRLQSPLKRLFTTDYLTADDPDGAMLVYAMGNFDELRQIADEIDENQVECTYMCYHDIFNYELGYLEIYALGTTKAAAIQRMAEQLEADRIVVFGDNLNDLPMMKSAHYSVAVGNAFPEVKAQANEVIGTNDEDAVIRWITADIEKLRS